MHPSAYAIGLAVALFAGQVGVDRANAQPLGVVQRAAAANQMILLGVTQGINALPPTSGQSFVYEYDATLDTYVVSPQVGPAVFRTPRTLGKGKLSLRFAASYFELFDSLGPIPYEATSQAEPELWTRLGLEVDAKVGLLSWSLGYGITDQLEFDLNIPVAIVDATGGNIGVFFADDPDLFAAARTLADLDGAIANGDAVILTDPFSEFGQDGVDFNEGTSIGLGQVGLAAKYALLSYGGFEFSPSFELLLPSPSDEEFAGPNMPSLIPRAIFSGRLLDELKAYADVGYNYTVDFQELSGFIWNAGLSGSPIDRLSLDLGVGGTVYDEGIKWTPDSFAQPDCPVPGDRCDFVARGDNTLGTNYLDFLAGFKVKVTESSVLNGAVRVPINDEGFRPYAAGTIAYEVYF